MPTEVLARTGLVALTLGLLVTGCGGGGNRVDAIKIAFLTDCHSPIADRERALAGAELPFLQRGSRLRGTQPESSVTDATIHGKRVELLSRCESYGDFSTLAAALRQVVEHDHADIVVGPNGAEEGLVIKQYARGYPGITFSATSGEQSTTLRHPDPNLFRFAPDTAQASAGLGAYAYRTLGWRNAVAVGEDDPAGWAEVAGFVAEFCSLGGNVVQRIWPPGIAPNYARAVRASRSHGVDGAVFPSDLLNAGSFVHAMGKRHSRGHVLLNLDPSAVAQGLTPGMVGLVGVSNWPLVPTPASRVFADASAHAFPDQPSGPYPYADFYSYDEMEPVLEALQHVQGDVSNGEQQFQLALARLHFQAPNGKTSLDRRHQAIAPTYLGRVVKRSDGRLFVRQIAVIPKVEQTFGGYFSPTTSLLSRQHPACKHGNPPAWVSSVPTTR